MVLFLYAEQTVSVRQAVGKDLDVLSVWFHFAATDR